MQVLQHRVDDYKSAIITDPVLTPGKDKPTPDPLEFESRLFASLAAFRQLGCRGVWLKIPAALSELVPGAIRAGFTYHSARPEAITLSAWLPHEEENKLPPGPYHFIGVGAFVLNSKDEILVVREKSGPSARLGDAFWKLPGGLVDRQEDFNTAAERELFEETGIRAKFSCMSSIQEVHHSDARGGHARGGTTDLYAVCVLHIEDDTQKITAQETEIAECKWMKAKDVLALPFYRDRQASTFAHVFHHAYDVATGKAQGFATERMRLGVANAETNVYYVKSNL